MIRGHRKRLDQVIEEGENPLRPCAHASCFISAHFPTALWCTPKLMLPARAKACFRRRYEFFFFCSQESNEVCVAHVRNFLPRSPYTLHFLVVQDKPVPS